MRQCDVKDTQVHSENQGIQGVLRKKKSGFGNNAIPDYMPPSTNSYSYLFSYYFN